VKVSTKNEYGQLKSIILGNPTNGHWPKGDTFFDRMQGLSTYKGKITRGAIPEEISQKANDNLLAMKDLLEDENVKVFRPELQNYGQSTTHYGNLMTGMHTYCPRDLLLSVGNMVIECPTPYQSRYREFEAYDVIKQEAMRDGCRWIAAPRARMEPKEAIHVSHGTESRLLLTERYPIFDAANVLKFDDKLVYLKTSTANQAGADWLQNVVGTEFEVVVWDDVYAHAHIDSTLTSLKKDLIMINASRVQNTDKLPKFLRSFRKLWIHDMAEGTFHDYPYASKWIGMNILSINEDTVMVDPIQKDLIKMLTSEGFRVIPVSLEHARTLGGGHHCVTCDLERE